MMTDPGFEMRWRQVQAGAGEGSLPAEALLSELEPDGSLSESTMEGTRLGGCS